MVTQKMYWGQGLAQKLRRFVNLTVVSGPGLYLSILGGIGTEVWAQTVLPDATLGNESSLVRSITANESRIEGGAQRNGNLFHSFERFGVPLNQTVLFANPEGVTRIFSRVTGNSPSDINGTLGVAGSAHLFFINPNGVWFKETARLQLSGSFVVSTANGIRFGEQGSFSATSPESPGLLTVSPSAFFYNQLVAQRDTAIKVKAPLEVATGQSLVLLGGNTAPRAETPGVVMILGDEAELRAPSGRIELGGLGANGEVLLTEVAGQFQLGFPEGVARTDVMLLDRAIADVRTDEGRSEGSIDGEGSINGGGSISVNAQNIVVSGQSGLLAGIAAGAGTSSTQAGDITLNATDTITVSQSSPTLTNSSGIQNRVNEGATGAGGKIQIQTTTLRLEEGGVLSAGTLGTGDGGEIRINALGAVVLDGISVDGSTSQISSVVGNAAVGEGGNIEIAAQSLTLQEGAFLSSSTDGRGSAGSITLDISGPVNLSGFALGRSVNPILGEVVDVAFTSNISTRVGLGGIGDGGNIAIFADSLTLDNGAGVLATTFGQGNGGDISVEVDNAINVSGFSAIDASVGASGVGRGGTITLQSRSLTLEGGGKVSTVLGSDGQFSEGQRGQSAGDIQIQATDFVDISGVSTFSFPKDIPQVLNPSEVIETEGFSSGIFTRSEQNASGSPGSIVITTGAFRVADGGVVNVLTRNEGDAGTLLITANTFEASGGGQIISGAQAQGNAADIKLTVSETILLTGTDPTFADRLAEFGPDIVSNQGPESGLFAPTGDNASGNGGTIIIDPETVEIRDGATIEVNSEGTGRGGEIKLISGSLLLDNGSIAAESASGAGGDITLTILNEQPLFLGQGSFISASAGTVDGPGQGGNITITARLITAPLDQNNDIFANAFQGAGGSITLNTEGIFGLEFRDIPNPRDVPTNDITVSSTFGTTGVFETSRPEVDATGVLKVLPTATIDAIALIDRRCNLARSRATTTSFTITGQGGLPTNPNAALGGTDLIPDLGPTPPLPSVQAQQQTPKSISPAAHNRFPLDRPAPILEAQGWVVGSTGGLQLVASPSQVRPTSSWQPSVTCPAPASSPGNN